jgi:tetratricopeptide (TPR) repeat protein
MTRLSIIGVGGTVAMSSLSLRVAHAMQRREETGGRESTRSLFGEVQNEETLDLALELDSLPEDIKGALQRGDLPEYEVESLALLHRGQNRRALAKAQHALETDRSNIVLHLVSADAASALDDLETAQDHLDLARVLFTGRVQRTRPHLGT